MLKEQVFLGVMNMEGKAGNQIPNQFRVFTKGGVFYQSYESIIAFKPVSGKIMLDEEKWDFSRTTVKYLCHFLGVSSKKEIEQNIKSNNYLLVNLN